MSQLLEVRIVARKVFGDPILYCLILVFVVIHNTCFEIQHIYMYHVRLWDMVTEDLKIPYHSAE